MEELPKRKPTRLNDYDYSSNGAYFVTICVKDRRCLLGNVVSDNNNVGASFARPQMKLSKIGEIIENEIKKFNTIYNGIIIDKFVIMPNHIHMIIMNNGRPQVAPTLSRMIQQFKGKVTKRIGYSIWQKLFYDHIIRNEKEYKEIWKYIDENPIKWQLDKYYIKGECDERR